MTPHAPWTEGPADFSIGLKPIGAADWFEGGEAPEALVARKAALLARSPSLVWAETPGSEAAQHEVLALIEHWAGRTATTGGSDLWRASLLVSDDLCLMERVGGAWTLTALSLCAGSLFTADEVVGRPLASLHAPVPGFAERLLARVERIFDRLPEDAVLMRRNWSVLASGELHLPHAAPVRARSAAITPETAGEALHVRVERQTLRRLPVTGGVLFSIRVWPRALATLDPAETASLERAWRAASEAFRTYKGLPALDPVMHAWFAGRRTLRPAGESDAVQQG